MFKKTIIKGEITIVVQLYIKIKNDYLFKKILYMLVNLFVKDESYLICNLQTLSYKLCHRTQIQYSVELPVSHHHLSSSASLPKGKKFVFMLLEHAMFTPHSLISKKKLQKLLHHNYNHALTTQFIQHNYNT